MEVKRIYRKLAPMARKLKDIALVSSIVILSSCSDELPVPVGSADGPGAKPGTYVEVPINLIVGSDEGGTRAICDDGITRSINDPDGETNGQPDPDKDGENTVIKDVLIIQFDGPESDDPAAVEVVKIEDYQNTANRTVKLVAKPSTNLIMAIANIGADTYLASNINTGENGSNGSKLSQVRKLVKDVPAQQDVFGKPTDAVNGEEFPDNATYRPIMNGMIEVDHVNTDIDINIPLKRNIARIDFNLTVLNSLKLEIHSIELCNAPDKMNYVTNYTEPTGGHKWPTISTFQTKTYTPTNPDWKTKAKANSDNTAKVYHARFYMPASTRGSVAACTDPKTRLSYAPEQSPYVRILAKTDAGEAFIYTFHLGENMTTDFNLMPNHKYYYDIKINTLNAPETDLRVVRYPKLVDFTPTTMGRANCYILNPSPIPGIVRHFRIPIDRIDEFWGAAYDEDKYEDNVLVKASESPYECVHANCLYADQHWTADVIWSDFKLNPTVGQESTTQVSLIATCGTKGCKDYIEISVPHGASGNFTIGVKKTDTSGTITSDILWSWHLWVTDYNPYPAKNYTVLPGKTEYLVPFGKVIRLNSDAFKTTGLYNNSFALDRTVGDLMDYYNNIKLYPTQQGSLHYNWGRKDPIYLGTKYKLDGTVVNYASYATDIANPVAYTVNNPMAIMTSAWYTPVTKYNPKEASLSASYIWNDPNVLSTNYHKTEVMKISIFDPSPLGWSLPVISFFSPVTSIGKYYRATGRYAGTSGDIPETFYLWTTSSVSNDRNYATAYNSSPEFWNYTKDKGMPVTSVMLRNGNYTINQITNK